MSTPNPLAPQGSLLEKQARSKSTLQVAALIVGLHVFGLGGFLILGCKKEEAKTADSTTAAAATNEVAAVTAPDTNAPVTAAAGTNLTATAGAGAAATGAGAGAAAPGGNAGVGSAAAGAFPGAGVGSSTGAGAAGSTAAPDAGTAPTGAATEYKIQKGDIAFLLAKKHNVTLKALQEANPNVDLKKLKVGATIQIPAPSEAKAAKAAATAAGSAAGTADATAGAADAATGEAGVYRVKGGDNLGKIAKKHGTTVKAIRALNGLTSDSIRVGQKLKLPAKSAAGAAAPAATDAQPAAQTASPTAAPAPTAAPVGTGVPGAK